MAQFEKQVGVIGEYEPELCAVSGKPVRGKHAVTFYQGDGVHYVRVLSAYVDQWKRAAPAYGFPESVIEEEKERKEEVFVLEGLDNPDAPRDSERLGSMRDSGVIGAVPVPASKKIIDPPTLSPIVPAARANKKESDE
jgi:hypothetical protein